MLRRYATAATTVVLGGALAACGASSGPGLNTVAVERAIAQSILTQHHLYTTVSCPRDVLQQTGRDFTCAARLDVGTYPLRVSQTDDNGHVRWANRAPLVTLDIGAVKAAIRHSIRAQRRLKAGRIACPRQVLQKAGIVFDCWVTVKGKDHRFTVTEVDGRGHVKYLGH